MNIGLVLYGDINTVSGGFLYDLKVTDFLLAAGDSVETISLPWVSYGRGIINNFSSALLNHLDRSSFDVLLQDELVHPSLFLLNKKLTQRFRLPIIVIIHHLRSSESRASWKNRVYSTIEKYYLASADGFIFNSCETHRVVTSLVGNSKPSIIALPGGDRFNQAMTKDVITAKALKPGPLKILFLGNIIPRKGLHTLIDALGGLPHHAWHLTVVGDLAFAPQYVTEVKQQVGRLSLTGKIDFLGSVTDSELFHYLIDSHLLVVPSSYEGFGIVYLEAMGFGLPVIGSTAGAAKEIITHGIDGCLVTPGDSRALSDHINGLIENRKQLCAMSLAALDRFSRHPSWSDTGRVVHQFLHRYEAN
jgi:glycosyltransferase involved in cell wall biosynthesis